MRLQQYRDDQLINTMVASASRTSDFDRMRKVAAIAAYMFGRDQPPVVLCATDLSPVLLHKACVQMVKELRRTGRLVCVLTREKLGALRAV
jgi:hypothetical protein